MRSTLLLILLFLFSTAIYPQAPGTVNNIVQVNGKPNVYAIVIGISSYHDERIPQLQFADKDAQVFANYLRSKAGGSVPADNIRLLVNADATSSAIDLTIDELVEKCNKDDLVFFYFSGHGDVENKTMFHDGYLICYNSPPNNYPRLALSIEQINKIANTLSVQKGAKVVLITDACHSGKLAGNVSGVNLAGEQLRAVKDKEVRMTSCADNQLSNEMKDWGGGRGVFSYYLVNGLRGLADKSNDGFVSVDEIKTYLANAFNTDSIIKREHINQTPVVNGKENFVLAKVDESGLREAEREMKQSDSIRKNAPPLLLMSAPMMPDSRESFLSSLKKKNLGDLTLQMKLDTLAGTAIPFALVKNLLGANSALERDLRENPDQLKRFSSKLAVAFDEQGQLVIEDYLSGNENELKKRSYYNISATGYDRYVNLFAVALKLVTPGSYLEENIKVKLHYFSGVSARMKMVLAKDPMPLYNTALAQQKAALALEENAPYIYNELGILSIFTRSYVNAKKYFNLAIEKSPSWALPWANLVQVYAYTGEFEKGIEAAEKAKAMQPRFQHTYINAGILYEKKGNLLQAEELFRESIDMDAQPWLPYERLGYVYMNTTDYGQAEEFFRQAEERKNGIPFFTMQNNPLDRDNIGMSPGPWYACAFDTTLIKQYGSMGEFLNGLTQYKNDDTVAAKYSFNKAIALDKKNPVAFHYLGKILYEEKNWLEAEVILKMAVSNSLDDTSFKKYYTDIFKGMDSSAMKDCILNMMQKSDYDAIEDRFILGQLYEEWHHFNEAIEQYRSIIKADPGADYGNLKLRDLLERTGRYKDEEELLQQYLRYDRGFGFGNNELNAFYERMTEKYPHDADWHARAGVFLYRLAAKEPEGYPDDRKILMPGTHEEQYVEMTDGGLEESYRWIPGTRVSISFAKSILYPRTEGIAYLLKADSLGLADDDAIADTRDKIGDLYTWQGLPTKAAPYYKQAARLRPDNANTRMKLIDAFTAGYHFSKALQLLDSLKSRGEINYQYQLLLAKYDIHSGRFTEADSLLGAAKKIYPFGSSQITDLQGRLQLLSQHPAEATRYYQQLLAANKNDPFTMYTMARLYSKLGKTDEAWKWLDTALEKGFSGYPFILKNDPYLEVLRRSPKWNELLKRHSIQLF